MWLNITKGIADPSKVSQMVETLLQDASLAPIRAAPGFLCLYLAESTEYPRELLSITVWESAEDGQAYLASPECRKVIASIQGYLMAPLERSYYAVNIDLMQQSGSRNKKF